MKNAEKFSQFSLKEIDEKVLEGADNEVKMEVENMDESLKNSIN